MTDKTLYYQESVPHTFDKTSALPLPLKYFAYNSKDKPIFRMKYNYIIF